MNNQRVQLLVDALGELDGYQCTSKLRDANGHMCVEGLACEVFRRETGRGYWEDPRGVEGEMIAFILDDEEEHYDGEIEMPKTVQKWYGFLDANAAVRVDQQAYREKHGSFGYEQWREDWDKRDLNQTQLVYLNDEKGLTFKELANVLTLAMLEGRDLLA